VPAALGGIEEAEPAFPLLMLELLGSLFFLCLAGLLLSSATAPLAMAADAEVEASPEDLAGLMTFTFNCSLHEVLGEKFISGIMEKLYRNRLVVSISFVSPILYR